LPSAASFSPVKPIDPEMPKAAVRRLFDQAGGIKRTASRLGYRGVAHVYAMADPADATEISYAQVVQLSGPEAPACAEHLAALCGGVFLPFPAPSSPLALLTAEAMREAGQAAAALVESMADGLTPDEARAVLPELADALRCFSQLQSQVAAVARRESD
jgi:hypothetical protein